MPDCPIWQAVRASTTNSELFTSCEIEAFGVAHQFTDGAHGCGNPTPLLLKEATMLFPDRSIASVVSIGAGNANTIVPQAGWFERAFPVGKPFTLHALKVAHATALENERVAEDIPVHCSYIEDGYYRLNMDQGTQGFEAGEWERQAQVTDHTTAYTARKDVSNQLDQLVTAVQGRSSLSTIEIGIDDPSSSMM